MTKTRKIIIGIAAAVLAVILVFSIVLIVYACATIDDKTQAEIDVAKSLRIQGYAEIRNDTDTSFENLMKQKIYGDWAQWVPDYESWLKWSDNLYFSDAVIDAIGGEQPFKDYQASMKKQRDAFTMEMGPIKSFKVVEGTTDAIDITYYMYLIPKNVFTRLAVKGAVKVTEVRELNTFKIDEATGELKVSKLVLTTTSIKKK